MESGLGKKNTRLSREWLIFTRVRSMLYIATQGQERLVCLTFLDNPKVRIRVFAYNCFACLSIAIIASIALGEILKSRNLMPEN